MCACRKLDVAGYLCCLEPAHDQALLVLQQQESCLLLAAMIQDCKANHGDTHVSRLEACA